MPIGINIKIHQLILLIEMVEIKDLSAYYDFLEGRCLQLAKKVVGWHKNQGDPDIEARYLVETAYRIISSDIYIRDHTEDTIDISPIKSAIRYLDLLDENLIDFLSGNLSGSDIIKQGGPSLWEEFNKINPLMTVFSNAVAKKAQGHIAGNEVLELGGGVGGTTTVLSEELKTASSFYFTDIKTYFLDGIKQELPDLSITTELLNLRKPPEEFPSFDLIYATNVLHVVSDIEVSLRWIADHLNPGGILILGEGSPYSRDAPWPLELMFSMFRGWWDILRFEHRPYPGWLLPEQWLKLFSKAGITTHNMEIMMDRHRLFGGIYQFRN